MDQSQMLSLVGGLYDKLVADVAAAVKNEIGATAMANIALDPTIFRSMVQELVEQDNTTRETIRDLITDALDNYDLDDNKEFSRLAERVDTLEERDTPVDADNDEFADAVRAVIRNNI